MKDKIELLKKITMIMVNYGINGNTLMVNYMVNN